MAHLIKQPYTSHFHAFALPSPPPRPFITSVGTYACTLSNYFCPLLLLTSITHIYQYIHLFLPTAFSFRQSNAAPHPLLLTHLYSPTSITTSTHTAFSSPQSTATRLSPPPHTHATTPTKLHHTSPPEQVFLNPSWQPHYVL